MTDKPLAHEEALPLGDEAELTAAEYAFRLGDPRGVDDLRTIARRVAEVDDPLPEAIAAFRDALAREPTDEDLRDWTRALADELAKPDGNRNKVMARIRELARAIDKPSSRRDAAKQVLELLADNRPLIPAFPPDETPAARAWMLNRWLPEGRVSMFSGKQGWGKSHIALLLAAAVAGGAERWMRQETEGRNARPMCRGDGVSPFGGAGRTNPTSFGGDWLRFMRPLVTRSTWVNACTSSISRNTGRCGRPTRRTGTSAHGRR